MGAALLTLDTFVTCRPAEAGYRGGRRKWRIDEVAGMVRKFLALGDSELTVVGVLQHGSLYSSRHTAQMLTLSSRDTGDTGQQCTVLLAGQS